MPGSRLSIYKKRKRKHMYIAAGTVLSDGLCSDLLSLSGHNGRHSDGDGASIAPSALRSAPYGRWEVLVSYPVAV
jgi:hypothetical protein